ncbi:hypothetical protein VTH06DRAFT_2761 [Thermothelomyces fergusii]
MRDKVRRSSGTASPRLHTPPTAMHETLAIEMADGPERLDQEYGVGRYL